MEKVKMDFLAAESNLRSTWGPRTQGEFKVDPRFCFLANDSFQIFVDSWNILHRLFSRQKLWTTTESKL